MLDRREGHRGGAPGGVRVGVVGPPIVELWAMIASRIVVGCLFASGRFVFSGVLQEFRGQLFGSTSVIHAGDGGIRVANQRFVTEDPVMVSEPHLADFGDTDLESQPIIEFRGGHVANTHFGNDQQSAGILHLFVGNATGPQHFDPRILEVLDEVGVVDPPLTVGFVVCDAKLVRVLQE